MTRRTRRGFTLLEVTVALVVVAVGVTALQRLNARSVTAARRHRDATRVALAGRSLLAEARLAPAPLGSTSGGDPKGLRWEREITATEHPRLHLVRIRVRPHDETPATEFVEVMRAPAS